MRGSFPDFLIVGAMKAGSTALANQLRGHPQIAMPPREVQFFAGKRSAKLKYSEYVELLETYRESEDQLVGEKSPSYSYVKKAAPAIHERAPQARLIWLLRNPINRTYSNYLHNVERGRESRTFEQALDEERAGKARFYLRYMDRSRYAEQIERFLPYFPLEQMSLVLFERFVKEPTQVTRETCQFLGVNPDQYSPRQGASNRTVLPKQRLAMHAAIKWGRDGEQRKNLLRLFRIGSAPGYPAMLPKTRDRLREEFQSGNERLARLTGLDLSVW